MAESAEPIDLAELTSLPDDGARQDYFAARKGLIRPELVWRIADESGRAIRVDLERAERLAATARWLAERIEDEAALARGLRAVANVLMYQRRYKAAEGVYLEALAGFERAGDELEAAITRSSAIGSLSHLARYDQALQFADAARRVFEKHDDRLHLARLAVNVGHVLSRQDRFVEAIERYREARALFAEIGTPADVAITLRNIAVCHQDLNDFHAALEAYRQAREFCREHGQPLVGLEVEYNIAYLYFLRGDYTQAIRLFEEARRYSQEQGDRHHVALCDLDLAEIFLELNLVHDAEHLAGKAFAAFDELGMEYETAKALAFQALAADRRGGSAKALSLLERASEMFRRQDNAVWVAMVDLYGALILFADNQFDAAVARAEAAFDGFAGSGMLSRTAACQILLARLALARGEIDAAREHARAALARARESGQPLLQFQAHLAAGQIEETSDEPIAALAAYSRAYRALERLRGQLPTDELKIAFGEDKQAVYEGLVAVSLSRGRSAAKLEAAFAYVETAKSRSLADLLAFGSPGTGAAGGDRSLAAEIQELREEIAWYYRQIDSTELAGGEGSQQRLERLRRESHQRERRLLRNLRRLRPADAELSSLQGSVVADPPTLRSALPEDACLVEYFIARGLLYAFILDHRRLEVRTLGEAARIRTLHRQLQFQLGKFAVGGDYVERFGELFFGQAVALLEELHGALLGDWRPGPEVRRLIIVPHDFLHQLPFHALTDGDRFLIDRLAISYAPSATVFQLCSARPLFCEERSLVLGVPDARAPRILDEVRAVAESLPASRLLIGEQATAESLMRLGEGCRFVHIATHGLYRRDNPMFSAIQLGDTRMSLIDLYRVKLNAELAVLSGCGTGLSDVRGSDELVGLTRGLLFAGARSVLATLWDVNDDSTAEFMRLFYGRLTEAAGPAAALQQAMVALREQHPHPYYWAPFVLTGRG